MAGNYKVEEDGKEEAKKERTGLVTTQVAYHRPEHKPSYSVTKTRSSATTEIARDVDVNDIECGRTVKRSFKVTQGHPLLCQIIDVACMTSY